MVFCDYYIKNGILLLPTSGMLKNASIYIYLFIYLKLSYHLSIFKGGALAILFAQKHQDLVKHVVISSPMIAKNKQFTRAKVN